MKQHLEKPSVSPFTRFMALVLQGVLFSVIYQVSNGYADSNQVHQVMATHLDTMIPLIPWMIVPYLSSGAYFLLAYWFINNRTDFHFLNQCLLLSTVIAGWSFYFYPLFFGELATNIAYPWKLGFDLIGALDKPFNQAPSLHVMYGVVLGVAFVKRFTGWRRVLIAGGIALMIASTLFVHQHHLVDVVSGLALASIICLVSQKIALSGLALIYFTLASSCMLLGLEVGSVVHIIFYGLCYLALGFALVSVAYQTNCVRLLGKGSRGELKPPSKLLLAPYRLVYWLFWRWQVSKDTTPVNVVLPWLGVGRRLTGEELSKQNSLTHIIDLGAELPSNCRLKSQGYSDCEKPIYISLPVLDLQPITFDNAFALCCKLNEIHESSDDVQVYLHCTIGLSRSYAMLACYLAFSGFGSAEEVKKKIRDLNPRNSDIHSLNNLISIT